MPSLKPLEKIALLDGNLFLPHELANPRSTPLDDRESDHPDPDESDTEKRQRLQEALEELHQAAGSQAHPYHALLLMDGDRLGKLLRDSVPGKISRALSVFVKQVNRIVETHDGMTVYAGGDDVLAMLPLSNALECAVRLRNAYGKAFSNIETDGARPTASCAVILAHYHNPLRETLRQAHAELDETAKEGNGRDSLAVAVMQPGGVSCRWVNRFGEMLGTLERLRRRMRKRTNYSSGFLYHMRERYGDWLQSCSEEERQAVALAEYLKSADGQTGRDEAEENVNLFLDACHRRKGSGSAGEGENLQIDGAFLAHFLAGKDYGSDEPDPD